MLVRHGRIVRADQPARGHEQEGEGLRTPSSVAAGASRGRARSKSLRCLCALRLRFDFVVAKHAVYMPKQVCRLLLSRFLAASKRMSMRIVTVKEKVCSGVLYIAVFATETCQFACNGHRKLPSCDQSTLAPTPRRRPAPARRLRLRLRLCGRRRPCGGAEPHRRLRRWSTRRCSARPRRCRPSRSA